MRFIVLSTMLSVLLVACASERAMQYAVSSQSPYLCCRTMRYSTWPFPSTAESTVPGPGVVVRLNADTLRARCAADAPVGIVVANNSDSDIYIPFSKELDGMRLKLYPWRMLYRDGEALRLARQLQYNDMLEREDGVLRFFKLPAGRQVTFDGVIPQRWLCFPTTTVSDSYLDQELKPLFYVDRTRALRNAEYKRDPELRTTVALRYDVAYTTLHYLDALPVLSRSTNGAGDTTQILIGVKEEPGDFLDASQSVARSNTVVLRIMD